LALLGLCIIFFSCAAPPYSTTNIRKIPEDFFGIAPYRRTLTPEDFPLIDELGVVWLRRTFRWSGMEQAPGEWDFSAFDEYVEISKDSGKKLLAILAYTAPWLTERRKSKREITGRELPYYLNYIETVVRRYKGKVDAYEIWNEPNMGGWDGSTENFIIMTRSAIERIRSIDPDVKILAGSFWRAPEKFLREMAASGVFNEADGISFHPYAIKPENSVKVCDSIFNILKDFNYSGEIWVTEMGYPTSGWFPTRVSEKQYPSYIVKTLAGIATRNINVLLWYEFFDEYNPGEIPSRWNSENFFGLVYPNSDLKSGYHAFSLCGKNLAGKEYRPDLPKRNNLPERTVSLCFSGGELRPGLAAPSGDQNENVLIIWNENGSSYPAKIYLPGSDQRLYDIGTGTYKILEQEIFINKTPLFITWTGNPLLAVIDLY